ncbi:MULTISPECIES: chemotaxis protein CheW [Caloramator]|uniref:Purine-binding chemotaxis protein CheW n=1 Tax=Caloramator proteoclasticus DSM 10124 TaxID=1121262 RepID=A0A1M5BH11_9CLOT|nr:MULTISPECIES: chemotaxis protein CheW [Caloramator]SHF41502.1 purine-binding chemotaxis protein CheW [Caloramator proteoclasticus DSM 10124]
MSTEKVVVFKLNGEDFAVDIQQVERILGYVSPTQVPEAPVFIKGIIKYQDSILPLIDLNIKFKRESNDNVNSKIIVVRNNSKSIGLLVDDVQEVIDIYENESESTPEIISGYSNKYIKGIIKKQDRIIMMIDTDKLLSKEELNTITSF